MRNFRQILLVSIFAIMPLIATGSIVYAQSKTKTYNNPTYKGLPIDPTTFEFNGNNEKSEVEDTANLFCEWQGYKYALEWKYAKNQPLTERGTYRFSSINNKNIEFCDFCRWHFTKVRCTN